MLGKAASSGEKMYRPTTGLNNHVSLLIINSRNSKDFLNEEESIVLPLLFMNESVSGPPGHVCVKCFGLKFGGRAA